METNRRRRGGGANEFRLLSAAVALSALILAMDWRVELGFAAGVSYVGVIFLASCMRREQAVWVAALITTVLILIGFGISPDGGEMWKALSNRGLALGVIWGAAFLLSERIRLENELRHLNDELAALNRELTQSNTELQQFGFSVSHDLQAPLTLIQGYAALLLDDGVGRRDDQAEKSIRQILTGVGRMQRMISDLLAVSRVESRAEEFRSVALDETLDEAIEILKAWIVEHRVEITREDLPVVLADRAQMVQLMQNLVGNAIKYRGGEEPRVHVSARKDNGMWVVSVRDNGVGISPADHARIFECFQQLDKANLRGGNGIGLAVCQRIVQRHGGRIFVDSKPGAGSTFSFTLPVANQGNN